MRSLALLMSLVLLCALTQCKGPDKTSRTSASFQIPKDLSSLVQSVGVIVVGKVSGVPAGRTTGEGDARLQFNDVRITVEKRLKGDAPAEVVVEQLAAAGRTVTSEVGPRYERGERYVLFLRSGEGTRYVTSTQGRYLLRGGRVWPTEPGLVAENFKGMDEARFVGEIQASVAHSGSSGTH